MQQCRMLCETSLYVVTDKMELISSGEEFGLESEALPGCGSLNSVKFVV